MKRILFLILFGCLWSLGGTAQVISTRLTVGDTLQTHILETVNGDRFVGRVTKIENTTVYFLFKEKIELEYGFSEIKALTVAGEETEGIKGANGEERREELERRRREPADITGTQDVTFMPSAFILGRGKKEYRNTMIFYNQFTFGFGDNVEAGFDFMPLIAVNIFAGRLKAGFSVNKKIHLGAGISTYGILFNDTGLGSGNSSVEGFTYGYGVMTFGSRDKFFNLGIGHTVGYNPDTGGALIINPGTSLRLGNRWKLTADLLFTGSASEFDFYSFGAAWFNGRHRFDFGMVSIRNKRNTNFGAIAVPVPFARYARTF